MVCVLGQNSGIPAVADKVLAAEHVIGRMDLRRMMRLAARAEFGDGVLVMVSPDESGEPEVLGLAEQLVDGCEVHIAARRKARNVTGRAREMLRRLKDCGGRPPLHAWIKSDNRASRMLLKRLGFKKGDCCTEGAQDYVRFSRIGW